MNSTLIFAAVLALPYNFTRVPNQGNESAAFEAMIPEGTVLIEHYEGSYGWVNVEVAFGEVRHVWANKTPLGEFGIASASSRWNETKPAFDAPGCALPNFDFVGLAWRVGCVGPKDRVSLGLDGYVQFEDIIAYLRGLKEAARAVESNSGSMAYGLWEEASLGWG